MPGAAITIGSGGSVISRPFFTIPPVTGGTLRVLPGGDATYTARNLFNTAAPMTVIGAPTYNDNRAQFTGLGSYINTGVTESASGTYIVICRSGDTFASATNRPGIIGNQNNTGLQGSGLYVSGTGTTAPAAQVRLGAIVDDTVDVIATAAISAIVNFSQWSILVGRINAGVNLRLQNMVTTTMATEQSTTTTEARARVLNASPIQVGSLVQGSTDGDVEVAIADYYPRCLTDTEVNTVIANMRLQLAARPTPIIL